MAVFSKFLKGRADAAERRRRDRLLSLGRRALRAGRYDEAGGHATQLLAHICVADRDQKKIELEAYLVRAKALVALGNPDQALLDFDSAASIGMNADMYLMAARTALGATDPAISNKLAVKRETEPPSKEFELRGKGWSP